jgi:hypothetical protein
MKRTQDLEDRSLDTFICIKPETVVCYQDLQVDIQNILHSCLRFV